MIQNISKYGFWVTSHHKSVLSSDKYPRRLMELALLIPWLGCFFGGLGTRLFLEAFERSGSIAEDSRLSSYQYKESNWRPIRGDRLVRS